MHTHNPIYLAIAGIGMAFLAIVILKIHRSFPGVRLSRLSWAVIIWGELLIAAQGVLAFFFG